jgi:hypothetical protein
MQMDLEELPHKAVARRVVAHLKILPWTVQFPLPGHDKSLVVTALTEGAAAVKADPDNALAYALVASCRFILGDVAGAMSANGILKERLQPEGRAVFYLNQAVFRLRKHSFDAALESYREAKRLGVNYQVAASSIIWLEAATQHLDPAYEFGLAILQDDYYDEVLALEHYRNASGLLPVNGRAARHARARIAVLTRRTAVSTAPTTVTA